MEGKCIGGYQSLSMRHAHSRICGGDIYLTFLTVINSPHYAIQNSRKIKVCNNLLPKGTTSLKTIAGSLITVDTR